jgi:hypothetical protein
MKTTIVLLTTIILSGCFFAPDKKLFIKSVQADDTKRVDWYFFSLISGFSRIYLQYVDKDAKADTFFESFYLSDSNKTKDTLTIQVYKNDYKLDTNKVKALGLVIKMDTTGGIWNQASSRLGRLQSKNVNFKHSHFADSYCPRGECY